MHEKAIANPLITLTEAAKITPGRPSTNCLWRWCRRGVLSRGGERVRLEHGESEARYLALLRKS